MTILRGQAELCWRGSLFSASMFEEITVKFSSDQDEVRSLAGLRETTSSTPDVEVTATILDTDIATLALLFPHVYNPAVGGNCGQLLWGSSSCAVTPELFGKLNIHYTCEADDCNDIFLYNAQIVTDFELSYKEKDARTIKVMWKATPDIDGNVVRIGTGDLTQASKYDCATETSIAV